MKLRQTCHKVVSSSITALLFAYFAVVPFTWLCLHSTLGLNNGIALTLISKTSFGKVLCLHVPIQTHLLTNESMHTRDSVEYFILINSICFIFCKVVIVVLVEEEVVQVQEVLKHKLVRVLSNLKGSLTLRVQMPSLTRARLKRNFNRNSMKI